MLAIETCIIIIIIAGDGVRCAASQTRCVIGYVSYVHQHQYHIRIRTYCA